MLNINYLPDDKDAINFCHEFIGSSDRPKIIFGRTKHAQSVAEQVEVDGFVDDFTGESKYLGKPVFKTENIPRNALVLSVVLGKPLTVKRKLDEAKLDSIDYFSFYKNSGLSIEPITCWNEFAEDFNINKAKYKYIYNLLADEESRMAFQAIVNFRLSGNLAYMVNFTDLQNNQYFEPFLELSEDGEIFADIGGFDGLTSLAFAKHCPNYEAIYFFEPERNNMLLAREKLKGIRAIQFYEIALSNNKEVIFFSTSGSTSKLDDKGDVQVHTELLDDVLSLPVSYIKMDIEGAEGKALTGSQETIQKYHPRLAVCVYHKGDDFWKIPEQVLSYRQDYKVYLRHYTEGVDETVMYFIPQKAEKCQKSSIKDYPNQYSNTEK